MQLQEPLGRQQFIEFVKLQRRNSVQCNSTIPLEEDSNAILLTYRFYGEDNEDIFLNEFVNANNLGLTEYLIIPKGRLITYYVENGN